MKKLDILFKDTGNFVVLLFDLLLQGTDIAFYLPC